MEPAEAVLPAVLTVGEVAKTLKIGLSFAYELVNSGRIPGVMRLGRERAVRIERSKFEQWLKEQATA